MRVSERKHVRLKSEKASSRSFLFGREQEKKQRQKQKREREREMEYKSSVLLNRRQKNISKPHLIPPVPNISS